MELIYAWIEKFRNYNEVELNFSGKFIIKYDKNIKSISISTNKSYIPMYPEYITNINAIVGKNGVGKTNLLDVLGLRTNDRNKTPEFEVKYNKNKGPYRIPDDVEAEIKHSIYYFIYYMGKDENNQDLFCFEGNDIESFQSIIKFESGLSIDYWKSKYWFAFICNYKEGMLIHKYDLNIRLGDYRTEILNDSKRFYGDYLSEQDKLVILSLRENLSNKYYDYNSTKPEDDYKISVPRRNANFQSKLLAMKIEMLYKQLQNPKRLMFQNNKYTLKISYDNVFDENKLLIQYSYNELNEREREVCKVLESFVKYLLKFIEKNKIKNLRDQLNKVTVERKSLKGYKNYYYNIIEIISDIYFKDKSVTQHILKYYIALTDVLSTNKSVEFYKNFLKFNITKQINIDELLNVIEITVDEKIKSDLNEMIRVFGGFFDYSIEDLSDGETAYLGLFASLYEQVSLLTPKKEKYIILLDEPEGRMHPELTRSFINELLLFLRDLSENKKKFQVVISTHSPFILSDIQSDNIIYLEKDNNGYCKPMKRTLNTFGANIHTLLKDGFFMTSTMGEFATSKIKEVISFINNSTLENVTEDQKKECLFIINSIGEPLVHNKIMAMFNEKIHLKHSSIYKDDLPTMIIGKTETLKKQNTKFQIGINELEEKNNDKD